MALWSVGLVDWDGGMVVEGASVGAIVSLGTFVGLMLSVTLKDGAEVIKGSIKLGLRVMVGITVIPLRVGAIVSVGAPVGGSEGGGSVTVDGAFVPSPLVGSNVAVGLTVITVGKFVSL